MFREQCCQQRPQPPSLQHTNLHFEEQREGLSSFSSAGGSPDPETKPNYLQNGGPQGSGGMGVSLQGSSLQKHGTASPVHVGPQVLGGVVVDDPLHALHVNASSCGVCADEAGEREGLWALPEAGSPPHPPPGPAREAAALRK